MSDDIKLPPLPPEDIADGEIRVWTTATLQSYARAAVEADRSNHIGGVTEMVPSDAWALIEKYADAVAQYNEALRIDVGTDDAGAVCLAVEKQLRALLSRYSSGQPAASAEPTGYAYRYPDGIRFNDGREVNGCKPTETLPYWFGAAPVAQEPIGVVCRAGPMYSHGTTMAVFEAEKVPVGTKLYAFPVSAQAQPLTTGQILSLERRSSMSDDEAIRFARSVESALIDQGLPYEQALAALVDKIIPGLDTGDLLADAEQASAALDGRVLIAQEPARRDWKAIDAATKAYLDGYELEGEGGSFYTPNSHERLILDDAIAGLLSDDDFMALMAAAVAAQAQPPGDVDGLTAIYDAFGIGSAARTPGILMANIRNAVRRSQCLSAIEGVLTVETPPAPDEGDDEPGEECLLRWGADPEGYAEHFTAALAQFQATQPTAQDREDALSQAARDVLAERQRQISVEGWTPEHDDTHSNGSLGMAAACYCEPRYRFYAEPPAPWPWDKKWWKPSDRRRDLIKAGALILAEIERIDRAAARAAKGAA